MGGSLFTLGLSLVFVPTLGELIKKVKQMPYVFATYVIVIILLMSTVLLMALNSTFRY